jgi:Zn-dependent protease
MLGGVPLIGWAKPVPVIVSRLRNGRRSFVLVAAAGPASNVVLAFLAATVLTIVPVSPVILGEPNLSAPLASLLSTAVHLNILLAVFNMLPIPPLDGGNVLSGLLPPTLGAALDGIRPYGFVLLYLLLFTGGFEYLVVPPSNALRSLLP